MFDLPNPKLDATVGEPLSLILVTGAGTSGIVTAVEHDADGNLEHVRLNDEPGRPEAEGAWIRARLIAVWRHGLPGRSAQTPRVVQLDPNMLRPDGPFR